MRKLLILFICLLPLVVEGQTYAIPNGAYGLGKFTRGAYSSSDTPQILYVDTLIDADYNSTDSTGSLRWALEKDTARVILFEVSGYIPINSSTINVYNDYVSIYGQTAPSPGITITGDYYIILQLEHCIIQNLRFRPSYNGASQRDGLSLINSSNVFIDKCSFSYSIDELLDFTGVDSATVQNSIFYQPIGDLNSKGHIYGDNTISASTGKNLYIHCGIRTPLCQYEEYEKMESFNNLTINTGYWGFAIGGGNVNSEVVGIGNEWRAGNDTRSAFEYEVLRINNGANSGISIYLDDNYSPTRVGSSSEWNGVVSYQDGAQDSTTFKTDVLPTWAETNVYSYTQLEDSLTLSAGARNWSRDSVDIIALDDMANGTGNWITTQSEAYYPTLAENTTTLDIPDNPHADAGDGYSNLEVWASLIWACDTTTITSTAVTTSAPNGTITTTTTGGLEPYTYDWSPGGETTQNLTGLDAGTYSVIVTDDNGCVGNGSWDVDESTSQSAIGLGTFNSGLWTFQGGITTFTPPPYSIPNLYIGDSIFLGNNATMNGANDYVTGLGSLSPDMVTNPGFMTLDFTSGNQAVKLDNGDLTGVTETRVYIRAKRTTTDEMSLHIGRRFASTVDNSSDFEFTPDTVWSTYIVTMRGTSSDVFWIGIGSARNTGADFLIDYCVVYDLDTDTETNEQTIFATIPKVSRGGKMVDSIQNNADNLAIVGMVGNSIFANSSTESIPAYNDEGEGERPPRLTNNNVARQIYDTLFDITTGFNKALYRRSDHVDWSLTGTWIDTTGFGVLIPAYTTVGVESNYSYTATPNAIAEIIVPDGYENMAIIYHKALSYYGANYDDSIYVQLNGGSIAANGDTIINSFRNTSANWPDGMYEIEEYSGLPSGANTITITKDNTADNFVIWGVAYWTGKTIMVLNYARGGNSMEDLWVNGIRANARLDEDISYRMFDYAIIEETGINEAGDANTLEFQQAYYENILNIFKSVPHVVVTTHPFGCDPGCSTNYYTLLDLPVDLERRYDRSYNYSFYDSLETYNIFRDFETNIIGDGGSLTGGEGGETYTTDGQHLNVLGTETFIDFLMENILK